MAIGQVERTWSRECLYYLVHATIEAATFEVPGSNQIKEKGKFHKYLLSLDSTMPPPFLAVISLLLLISFLKFIHKIIWIPLRIQYHFKKQGITGPSYLPISGNLGELRRLYAAAQSSKSMPYHRSGQGSTAWYQGWLYPTRIWSRKFWWIIISQGLLRNLHLTIR